VSAGHPSEGWIANNRREVGNGKVCGNTHPRQGTQVLVLVVIAHSPLCLDPDNLFGALACGRRCGWGD
jgi:hypothetical protein